MINIVCLKGRFTADPELRATEDGTKVVSFRIAVNRHGKDESGKRKADFFNIIAWRKTAEFIAKYFHKGQEIAITGRLQQRTFVDNSGNNRSVVEVIADNVDFCGGKQEGKTEKPFPENDDYFEIHNDADFPF